jgi:hypothetical protein
MLVRREGETVVTSLKRLDRSIGKGWANETIIDEVNESEQGLRPFHSIGRERQCFLWPG